MIRTFFITRLYILLLFAEKEQQSGYREILKYISCINNQHHHQSSGANLKKEALFLFPSQFSGNVVDFGSSFHIFCLCA